MSRKLLVGTLVVSAGVLAIVFSFNQPKPVYARSVSEFLAHPMPDQPVRIEGRLVHGSLCVRHEPCEYRFRMSGRRSVPSDSGTNLARSELSVHYPRCIVPDTFRDAPGLDVAVSVEGELCNGCHHFEASQILAKCPGKYEMRERGSVDRVPTFVPPPECPEP